MFDGQTHGVGYDIEYLTKDIMVLVLDLPAKYEEPSSYSCTEGIPI